MFNFLLFFVSEGTRTASNFILSRWADDADRDNAETRDRYMLLYGVLGISQATLFFGKELIMFLACAAASKTIHESLLDKVMHSPMSFFDSNPLGRILNRFSSDIDTVDQTIPFELDDMLNCILEVAAILVIITYSTPWFLAALLPLAAVYFLLQKLYIASSRQIKRLDMVSKSPIFSHFTETVTGAASIRAFGQTERFIAQSGDLVAENNKCLYLSLTSNRWLGVRLETLGNCVVLAAGLLAVAARATLSPGLAGLSVSYSLVVTETLNWLVRMVCALETNSVSLERIFEYAGRPSEAAWEAGRDREVGADWPQQGALTMTGVTARYRPDLPAVLTELSLAVGPGERVGVCGRTGAGKSSLALVLFRLLEPEAGTVRIDGEDLAGLGLQRLRSALTVIPQVFWPIFKLILCTLHMAQDPALFSRSLRFNLDPAGRNSEAELEQALVAAGLPELAQELDMPVQERGENFSVGQRQLICLARALLRRSRLLLLDEATAAVDLETDGLVQRTVREQFSGCTVLTIAHRLHTILDSDRVLVLDQGTVREFDTPAKLLNDVTSVFYSLARESGLV